MPFGSAASRPCERCRQLAKNGQDGVLEAHRAYSPAHNDKAPVSVERPNFEGETKTLTAQEALWLENHMSQMRSGTLTAGLYVVGEYGSSE